MAMMSAWRGGSTMPSETASAIETTSIAPCLCAISAIASTSSIVPKKFGDWISTHAVSRSDRLLEFLQIQAAVVAVICDWKRHALMGA